MGQGGHAPKFLTYLVILCFEKQCPKQNYCCSPKVKYFAPQIVCPPKIFGLATPLIYSTLFIFWTSFGLGLYFKIFLRLWLDLD